MDFSLSSEQTDAAALAATIFAGTCSDEMFKHLAATDKGRFDQTVWDKIADAGLLGLALSELHGGSGLGFAEACSVLIEAGRTVAPLPLATHLVAAMTLDRFGDSAHHPWVSQAALGSTILTCAVAEDLEEAPERPTVTARQEEDSWVLDGTKTNVVAGTRAGAFLVPASTADGVVVLLVTPAEVTQVDAQHISDSDVLAQLVFADARVPADRHVGDAAAYTWMLQHLSVAVAALQFGTVEGALALTADYAKTREQFGRPIGTFQAVSQRLADGYIDNLGTELTLWQAVWQLQEGLDAAEAVAIAKLWAADAGHRMAHTTVHIHGGVGIDLDGRAHRYFTAAKRNEFLLGGATQQARQIGALLAQ